MILFLYKLSYMVTLQFVACDLGSYTDVMRCRYYDSLTNVQAYAPGYLDLDTLGLV